MKWAILFAVLLLAIPANGAAKDAFLPSVTDRDSLKADMDAEVSALNDEGKENTLNAHNHCKTDNEILRSKIRGQAVNDEMEIKEIRAPTRNSRAVVVLEDGIQIPIGKGQKSIDPDVAAKLSVGDSLKVALKLTEIGIEESSRGSGRFTWRCHFSLTSFKLLKDAAAVPAPAPAKVPNAPVPGK